MAAQPYKHVALQLLDTVDPSQLTLELPDQNVVDPPSTPGTPSTPDNIELRFYVSPSPEPRDRSDFRRKNRLSTLFLPPFEPQTEPPSPPMRAIPLKPYPKKKIPHVPSTGLPLGLHRSQQLALTSGDIPEPDPQIDYFGLQTLVGSLGKLLGKRDHKRYDYLMDARKGYYSSESHVLSANNLLIDAKAWGECLRNELEELKQEFRAINAKGGLKYRGKGEHPRSMELRREWQRVVEWVAKNEVQMGELAEQLENAIRIKGTCTEIFRKTKEVYIESDMEPMMVYWREAFAHKFVQAAGAREDEKGDVAGKLSPFLVKFSDMNDLTDGIGGCDSGILAHARENWESHRSTPHSSSTEDPCPECLAAEDGDTLFGGSA